MYRNLQFGIWKDQSEEKFQWLPVQTAIQDLIDIPDYYMYTQLVVPIYQNIIPPVVTAFFL